MEPHGPYILSESLRTQLCPLSEKQRMTLYFEASCRMEEQSPETDPVSSRRGADDSWEPHHLVAKSQGQFPHVIALRSGLWLGGGFPCM